MSQAANNYIGIDLSTTRGDDSFMTEELLVPKVDSTDGARLHMFTQHITQALPLRSPELPRWYTGYEKQIGELSSSLRVSPSENDLKLWLRIDKSPYNRFYILIDEVTKTVYVHNHRPVNITESYAYHPVDCLEGLKEDDIIPPSSILSHSTSYQEDGNFAYGVNISTVFTAYKGLTYEDPIVISESAAKKFDSQLMDVVEVSMNTNDVLINTRGSEVKGIYKTFPDIGETVGDRILCARRRIDSGSVLHDFALDRMETVSYGLDDIFYAEGTVVDIDVYSNTTLENIEKYDYNSQVVKYLKANTDFWEELYSALKNLCETGYTLGGDSGFWYRRAEDYLNPEIKFTTEGGKQQFDHFLIRFTVLRTSHLEIGDKLTGRYGNKGTISAILPDDQMPVSADGTRVDAILNLLGVPNRLNFAQSFEHEISYISRCITRRIHALEYPEEGVDALDGLRLSEEEMDVIRNSDYPPYALYRQYISDVSPLMLETLDGVCQTIEDQRAVIADVLDKGMYLYCPPFYNTIDFWDLGGIYERYQVHPVPLLYNEHFPLIDAQFEDDPSNKMEIMTQRGLIVGDMYYIRLKHDSYGKFSARSAGYLSLSGVPSKNNRRFKNNRALYSTTAVRMGEMELTAAMALGDAQEVQRFLSLYSSNNHDRQTLCKKLLGISERGYDVDSPFNIEYVPKSAHMSRPMQGTTAQMRCLGIRLEDTPAPETEDKEEE